MGGNYRWETNVLIAHACDSCRGREEAQNIDSLAPVELREIQAELREIKSELREIKAELRGIKAEL